MADTPKPKTKIKSVIKSLMSQPLGILVKRLKSSKAFMNFYDNLSYDETNIAMFANIFEHDTMLADRVRLESYHKALTKYVKQGDVVIDLDTGTGILSFIAAIKNPKKIYAVDHSNIMDVAELVAQHNNIKNIEFVNLNSKNFVLDEKVDIIIHEQIGDFLFEENMIENVTDLRDRLLKPGGKILPSKFEFYIEPVMLRDKYRQPFIWEQKNIFGIDFSCVKEKCSSIVKDSYYYRNISPFIVEKMLSTDESVFTFDLEKIEQHDIPKRIQLTRTIKEDGRLDGFAVYFKANFDDEIFFSNSPVGLNTNWVGRLLRVESKNLRKGQSIEFDMGIEYINNPDSWRWSVKYSEAKPSETQVTDSVSYEAELLQ